MCTTRALYGEVVEPLRTGFRNFSIAGGGLIHKSEGPGEGQLGFLSFKLKFFRVGAYGKIWVLYG